MSSDHTNPPGLVVSTTEPILSFLTSASTDPHLSQELQQIASNLSSKPNVPYKSLRALWFASNASTRPQLVQLFSGSEFVLTSPKPREKSEELKARLQKLAEILERNAYAELVKDITPKKETNEPFSSYKDQLGFGLHVVVTMFTGYLVGYAAFRALFNHSPVMGCVSKRPFSICEFLFWFLGYISLGGFLLDFYLSTSSFVSFTFSSVIEVNGTLIFLFQNAAGGILGLVVSMLVETLIFIIRSSGQDLRSSSSTPKLKKNQ